MEILYYDTTNFRTGNHVDVNIEFAYMTPSGKLDKMLASPYGGVKDFLAHTGAKDIKTLPTFKDLSLDKVIDIYNRNN